MSRWWLDHWLYLEVFLLGIIFTNVFYLTVAKLSPGPC
jgi:hypothetical protein